VSTRRARAAARFASSDLRSVRGKTAGELQSPRSRWPFGAAVFALCLLAAANERPTYRRQAQRIRFILGLYRNDGPTGEWSGQSHFQARLLSTNKSKLPVDLI